MNETLEVLLQATSSGEVIKRMYERQKARHPSFSLTAICRRTGIASKGYLSDVMHGRRALALRYGDPIAAVFSLGPEETRLFKLLMAAEHEAHSDKRAELFARLESLRKTMAVERRLMPRRMHGRFFPYEVFAAFALFGNEPRSDDLFDYFGRHRRLEIERALELLTAEELVTKVAPDRYKLESDKIIFEGADGLEARRQFLGMALKDAVGRLDRWLGEPELAHFHATIISVNRAKYEQVLPRIKELLRSCETDLESGDADMIIRFSAQIHPLK